ncbi:MAG TPA: hypothetical protein VK187_01195, partial [Geobacteraceae bacterium]|nr:hypothetical protein [Geobacteraceae bacterium]
YNIDRVNELYHGAVVCPNCCATDVAVIKCGPHSPHELDYSQHRNPRVKLVNGSSPPTAGKFSCNGCFSSFDPPLPSHIVKLCEMLFKYYY